MKKKILSLGLVLVMSMSASMMAFAEDKVIETPSDGVYGGSETLITGDTKVPTIKITVPSEGAIGVNPYQMKHTVGSESNKTDSLISPEYTITNESDVPIRVDVAVTGAPGSSSEAVFSAAALKGTETTKSVFMYFDITPKATASATGSYTDTAYNAKSTSQVVVGLKTVAKKGVATLDAKSGANAFASYKFFGKVATNPTKAWTATDKVDAKLVFTFAPLVTPAP